MAIARISWPMLGLLWVGGAAIGQPSGVEGLELPDLYGSTTAADARSFDKYYFFHRDSTDFAAALADLRECDSLARGLTPGTGTGGIVSGIAVSLVAGAIASANRRALRRVNMRRCMFFKGYGRYGLAKAVWERFNFEEGNAPLEEPRRSAYLELQARAASGPAPASQDLGE